MYTDYDPILKAIKTERQKLATMIDEARTRITALDACADALVGTEALHSADAASEPIVMPESATQNGVRWSAQMIAQATKMLEDGETQRNTAAALGLSLGALQREIYRGVLKNTKRNTYA